MIPEILRGSELFVEYDKIETSKIEAKLIAYSVEKDAVVHLGLDYSETAQKYFPRSFFVERINENSDGKKFIANGEKINVEKTIIRKADGSTEVIEHGGKKASTDTSHVNASSTNN